jgi:hypothetical protein
VTPAVVLTTVVAPSVTVAPPAVTPVVAAPVVTRPRVGVLGAGEHRLVRAAREVVGRSGRQRRRAHGGDGQPDSGGQATDRSKNGHEVPLR